MAININGKFTMAISVGSVVIALVVCGMKYGMILSDAAANTEMIKSERKERIEAFSEMRREWVEEIRGLNQRIDRILARRMVSINPGTNHE